MHATVLMEVRAHLVWNWLSPSAVWIPGIKLAWRSSILAEGSLLLKECNKR